MICPKCGTPNRSSAKFCDECGYELPSVAPIAREMFDAGGKEANEKTCNPKSAPTADLNGVDEFNDSSNLSQIQSKRTISEDLENKVKDEGEFADANEITQVIPPVASDESLNVNKNEEQTGDVTAVLKRVDGPKESKSKGSGASGVDQKNYSVKNKDAKKHIDPKLKRNLIVVVIVAILAGSIAGITYQMQLWGGKVVPDVDGLSQAEAIERVESAGFKAEIEKVPSDDVEGIVIGVDPAAGSRAKEGSVVKVLISKARMIPDVVGMNVDEAKKKFEENGFTNIETTTEKADEAENSVIRMTPDANTRSKADAKITLVIAEPYRVPATEGMTKDEAVKAVQDAGFEASVSEKYNENVTEGSVVSTDPAKDTALKSKSKVTIYVAVHRSTKLEQLTRDYFSGITTFTMNGNTYEFGKLTAVQWTSGGNVAFTFSARQFQSTTWFGGETETRYLDYESIQGSISFDDNDKIIAINPAITT